MSFSGLPKKPVISFLSNLARTVYYVATVQLATVRPATTGLAILA